MDRDTLLQIVGSEQFGATYQRKDGQVLDYTLQAGAPDPEVYQFKGADRPVPEGAIRLQKLEPNSETGALEFVGFRTMYLRSFCEIRAGGLVYMGPCAAKPKALPFDWHPAHGGNWHV